MGLFGKKQQERVCDFTYAPEIHVGDVVTVSAPNGYSERFVVCERSVEEVGYGGFSKRIWSDRKIQLVKLNDWYLPDSVPPEQQVGGETAGGSASDDAPGGE